MIDINSIKRSLLIKYPFFGSIIANVNFIETTDCIDYESKPSIATDGYNVYYHPLFIQNITNGERIFVFAHELCHIAFNHILRSEGRDQELWNIATDAVINALLKKDGLDFLFGGVDIPEAINYNAEEMYNILLREKNSNKQKNHNKNQNNDLNSTNKGSNGNTAHDSNKINESKLKTDVGHDSHRMWNDAVKNNKEANKTEQKNIIEEQIKKISQNGEQDNFKQNKIERRKQLEKLRNSLAQQAVGEGMNTDSNIRTILDIGSSQELIDWRRILKEASKFELDWSYKNASIVDGVVVPSLEEILIPETEILLDTSGSINEMLLRNFLRECKNILQSSKIKVGCFDTKFYGFQEIKTESDIDNMKFLGGGGTNFDVASNAFSKRTENKIIFTDGDARMPENANGIIWIVFGNIRINPKGGRVIYIDENMLNNLCNSRSYSR